MRLLSGIPSRVYRTISLGVALFLFSTPIFAAKIIVQPVSDIINFACPFDVDILIDTQGEENV